MQYTKDQILQLAPDPASAKAGQQLATVGKWVQRFVHPKALWGDCQGSGSNPYKTMVDLENMAFKCSCPSRKFPCKHGLGLLLLFSENAAAFTVADTLQPSVEEWLGKREARAETKVAKEAKPVDEKAQQKRAESREKKIEGGIEELQLWIKDLLRTGIGGIPQNPYHFASNITARMVDAQAPGLALQLRRIAQIDFHREGWQKTFLQQLTKLYLSTIAYQGLDTMGPDWQQELRTLIGWTIPQEEVLAGEGIEDHWRVLSKQQSQEANLVTETLWLQGRQSGRFAQLLSFYAGNQIAGNPLMAGATMVGALAFYPGVNPQRALVKQQIEVLPQISDLHGGLNVQEMYVAVSDALALNPFLPQLPLLGNAMRLSLDAGSWWIVDALDQAMPLHNSEDEIWDLLAISGGKAFDCFGLYANGGLHIEGLFFEGHYHRLA